MCMGGGSRRRAAAAAEAEARRQREIEAARLADENARASAETERQAAAERAAQEERFNAQQAEAQRLRDQLIAMENTRLEEQRNIEAQRRAEREAELKRQNDERLRAEAQAAERAKQLEAYNAQRQQLVDQTRQQVEGAFAPYDDNFFNGFAGQYIGALKPQLDQQYDDARRGNIYSYARKGTLDSSAAARGFGRLDQARGQAEAGIANDAYGAAQNLRTGINSQKQALLNSVFGAINAAPVITTDNIGEANTALRQTTDALTVPVSLARSAASSIQLPNPGQIANPFSISPSRGRSATYTGYGAAPYTGGAAGSGRLVA